jgi:mRNA interferase MazF
VPLPEGLEVKGVVLADQIKSLDWRERNAGFLATLPSDVLEEVVAKAVTLLDPEEHEEDGSH